MIFCLPFYTRIMWVGVILLIVTLIEKSVQSDYSKTAKTNLYSNNFWAAYGIGKALTIKHDTNMLYVGTELGVLAALRPLEGTLIWRHVLEEDCAVVRVIVTDKAIAAVCAHVLVKNEAEFLRDMAGETFATGMLSITVHDKASGSLIWSAKKMSSCFRKVYSKECQFDLILGTDSGDTGSLFVIMLISNTRLMFVKLHFKSKKVLNRKNIDIVKLLQDKSYYKELNLTNNHLQSFTIHSLLSMLETFNGNLLLLSTIDSDHQQEYSLIKLSVSNDLNLISINSVNKLLLSDPVAKIVAPSSDSFAPLSYIMNPGVLVSSDLSSLILCQEEKTSYSTKNVFFEINLGTIARDLLMSTKDKTSSEENTDKNPKISSYAVSTVELTNVLDKAIKDQKIKLKLQINHDITKPKQTLAVSTPFVDQLLDDAYRSVESSWKAVSFFPGFFLFTNSHGSVFYWRPDSSKESVKDNTIDESSLLVQEFRSVFCGINSAGAWFVGSTWESSIEITLVQNSTINNETGFLSWTKKLSVNMQMPRGHSFVCSEILENEGTDMDQKNKGVIKKSKKIDNEKNSSNTKHSVLLTLSFDDMSIVSLRVFHDNSKRKNESLYLDSFLWTREDNLASICSVAYHNNAKDDFSQKNVYNFKFSLKPQHVLLKTIAFINKLYGYFEDLFESKERKEATTLSYVEPVYNGSYVVPSKKNEFISYSNDVIIASTCGRKTLGIDSVTGEIIFALPVKSLLYESFKISYYKANSARCNGPPIEGNFRLGQGILNRGNSMFFDAAATLGDNEYNNVAYSLTAYPKPRVLLIPFMKGRCNVQRTAFVLINGGDVGSLGLYDANTGELIHDLSVLSVLKLNLKSVIEVSRGADGTSVVVFDANSPCTFFWDSYGVMMCPNGTEPSFKDTQLSSVRKENRNAVFPLDTFQISNKFVLEGRRITEDCETKSTWRLNFKESGNRIAGISIPASGKHVLPVQMKEDGRVLYKFNSENTFAVLIQSQTTMSMTLVLVDASKGRVLTTLELPEYARLPSHLLMKEHKILVYYWNYVAHHFELLSIEIYQDEKDPGPWRLLFPKRMSLEEEEARASLQKSTRLKIVSKAYIIENGLAIRMMALSHTGLSVSPQSLILATLSNKLVLINHRLFSSRRFYVNQSSEEAQNQFELREESLPFYEPVIELTASDIFSDNFQVMHVRGIISEAASLESSSIIFAFGLDLFYRVILPAGTMFDSAGDLYNPPVMYFCLIVAFLGVALARIIAKKKEVEQKWQ